MISIVKHPLILHTVSEIRLLSQNWIIALVNKFVLLCTTISLIVFVWAWQRLPLQIPLWYSLPWGEDRLVSPLYLLILPFGALVWYIIGFAIALKLIREYLVFTQMLFISSLIVIILSNITLVSIIFLVL